MNKLSFAFWAKKSLNSTQSLPSQSKDGLTWLDHDRSQPLNPPFGVVGTAKLACSGTDGTEQLASLKVEVLKGFSQADFSANSTCDYCEAPGFGMGMV